MTKQVSRMREWWVKVFDLVAARRIEDAKLTMTVVPRLARLRYDERSRVDRIRAIAEYTEDDKAFLIALVDRLDEELVEVEYCFLDPNRTDGYVPSWVLHS